MLSRDLFEEVFGLAVAAGLAEPSKRPLLLVDLPAAQLPTDATPALQLRIDLTALNTLPGEPRPATIWLRNAADLARPTHPQVARRFEALVREHATDPLKFALRQIDQEIARTLAAGGDTLDLRRQRRALRERMQPPPEIARLQEQGLGTLEDFDELGRDELALTVRAWDPDRGTYLILKVMRPELGGEQAEHFRRGARLLAQLRCEEIVRLEEGLQTTGRFTWYAREYLPAGDLRTALAQGLAGPAELPLLLPVARGLHRAHREGIIHGAVRPANILLGGVVGAKLGEFDEAWSEDTINRDREHIALDAAAYLAPELCGLRPTCPSPLTDQYGLGATALTLVLGRSLTLVDDHQALLAQVPGALQAVLARALDPRPDRRFPHLPALGAALKLAIQPSEENLGSD